MENPQHGRTRGHDIELKVTVPFLDIFSWMYSEKPPWLEDLGSRNGSDRYLKMAVIKPGIWSELPYFQTHPSDVEIIVPWNQWESCCFTCQEVMIVFDSTQKACAEHVRTRTEHGLVEDFSNIGGSPQRGDVGSAGDQICALTLRGKPMEKPLGPQGDTSTEMKFTVFHRVSPCFHVLKLDGNMC